MPTASKITERFAASLQWRGKEYIVWDTDLDGFGVRVWGEGNRRGYIVQVKRHGRQFRKSLGKVGAIKAEAARERAALFRGAVRDDRDPRAEEKATRSAWTLDDAMDYFRGSYADAKKLAASYKADAEKLYEHHTPPRWRAMRLTDITQAMVTARHKEITGGIQYSSSKASGGARRANAWLTLLSRLFTLGCNHGHCTTNPASGIKKNDEERRERFLSKTELATLWRYLEKHENVEAAVCVQFILLTGCRPGEAFAMKWSDLDKNRGVWRKPAGKTKQRKQHNVALSTWAIEALNRLDTWKRSEYVFPAPQDASHPRSDKLKAFWRYVRIHCALPDVRLYDCRHSFASWLAMGGATELQIAAQLGHANTQTTKRYVHIAQDNLRETANIMTNVIGQAIGNGGSLDQQPLVAEKKGKRLSGNAGAWSVPMPPDGFDL